MKLRRSLMWIYGHDLSSLEAAIASDVDCIVFAERPKLATHKPAIRQRLAAILGLQPARAVLLVVDPLDVTLELGYGHLLLSPLVRRTGLPPLDSSGVWHYNACSAFRRA